MSVFVQQQATECHFTGSDSWIILSPIEQSIKRKIEAVGTPLKDWDIRINYGIKTGFNEAFVITTDKRNEIFANCKTEEERIRTAELIRPILRGRDIKRYGYNWADLWLIYIPWHFPYQFESIKGASLKAENAFKEQYPAVYNHMLEYKEPLSKRNKAETGIRYEWYALQRWGSNYWEDFSKPKIVWGNLNLTSNYALVENDSFINAPSSMIVPASNYLLAILNSKLADFYIRLLGVTRNGGYFEYKPMFIEQLPVPLLDINDIKQAQIKKLIEDKNYVELEYIVYNIYGLSQDEINYVNSL